MPTSAISSPTPDAASEIFTEASAAEYCALMTSFLVRNWSILRAELLLLVDQRLLLGLELLHLRVEPLQLALRELLALQRHAREILAVLGERLTRLRVELDDLLLELLLLQLQALLGRDDVSDALLDVLEQLHLLLVAVLQRVSPGSSALSSIRLILALITVENRPDIPATAPPFLCVGRESSPTKRTGRG